MSFVDNITAIISKHMIFLWFLALLQGTPAPSVLVVVIDTIFGVNNWEPIIQDKAIPVKCLEGLVNLVIERQSNENYVFNFISLHVTHSFLGCRGVPCEDDSILVVTK